MTKKRFCDFDCLLNAYIAQYSTRFSNNKAKQANKVWRVDRQTNALQTDRQTDRPTNGKSQL